MPKKKAVKWGEVAVGAAIIIIGTLTPIPDDLATLPLGIGLIIDGFHWL